MIGKLESPDDVELEQADATTGVTDCWVKRDFLPFYLSSVAVAVILHIKHG